MAGTQRLEDVGLQDPAPVTEHVRRLRLRIENEATHPQLLQTVRGVGYRFDAAAA